MMCGIAQLFFAIQVYKYGCVNRKPVYYEIVIQYLEVSFRSISLILTGHEKVYLQLVLSMTWSYCYMPAPHYYKKMVN